MAAPAAPQGQIIQEEPQNESQGNIFHWQMEMAQQHGCASTLRVQQRVAGLSLSTWEKRYELCPRNRSNGAVVGKGDTDVHTDKGTAQSTC